MVRRDGIDMPAILAIRLRVLGDVIATLGGLRALKHAAPDHKIVFVVDRGYHALLANVDYIDMLLPQPPSFKISTGGGEYAEYVGRLRELDLVCTLDFHCNTRSALLSFFSGAPVRVGFDVRLRKVLYTDVEPRAIFEGKNIHPRNSHESALALIRRAGFSDVKGDAENTIPVSEDAVNDGRARLTAAGIDRISIDNRRVVALNPGNPYPAKAWPRAYFVELARLLVAGGDRVVVLWGPGEKHVADDIVASAGEGVHLGPDLRLEDLPGVLRNLRAVVTIDSGMKHLAVATGVPSVTLFGPTSPHEWHMGGKNHSYLYPAPECSPCRLFECPKDVHCMSCMTPADVLGVLPGN